MKAQRREFEHIDVVAFENIFKQGRRAHFLWRNRLRRSHFARRQAQGLELGLVHRQTERQCHTLVCGVGKAANTKAGGIALDLIEQQQWRLWYELRRRFDQCADLRVPIRAFDQAVIADAFGLFNETAKISVCQL